MKKLFLLILGILIIHHLFAQDGSNDLSFNGDKINLGDGPSSIVSTTAHQTDGKILIGGGFTSYNGKAINRIARLNADGSFDTTFNPGEGANSPVNSINLQPDGKIIIGGNFTFFNGTAINRIARLNSDGSLDSSFNPGTGASNAVQTTTLQSDGKILIGGFFASYNGVARNRVARLNADGSLDYSFNPGTGANSTVSNVVLQPDGKIIIGGSFLTYNGTGRNFIARLNTDGSLDSSFIPGLGANSSVMAVSHQPDGKIIIGG